MSEKQKCIRCQKDLEASAFHQVGNRLFQWCKECGKTGTMPPPRKPDILWVYRYGPHESEIRQKARKLAKETGKSVVVFHDERGSMSLCPVNHLEGLRVTRNLLRGYRYAKGKVVEAAWNV